MSAIELLLRARYGPIPMLAPMVDMVKRSGEERSTARFINNDGTTELTA